jgi:hypothetical protein
LEPAKQVRPIQINERYRKGELSTRAIKQRLIIKVLAMAPDQTRNAIARQLVRELGLSASSAYHYVFKELGECLIPGGIVEQAAYVRTGMGPRILQKTGIPAFRLSEIGTIIAASLDEIEFSKRSRIVENYLISKATSDSRSFAVYEEALSRFRKNPQFGFEMLKQGVSEFLQGKLDQPIALLLKTI